MSEWLHPCAGCEQPFTLSAKQATRKRNEGRTRFYCSGDCWARAASVRHSKPTPIRGPCAQCGSMFAHRVPTKKYCSPECQAAATGGHARAIGGRPRPEYVTWQQMRSRCLSPTHHAWRHYGGRGIAIAERWNDFAAFLADMGPRPSAKHSLDRIDADGDYTPENCRWADWHTQGNNRRNNHRITHAGETLTVAQWAARAGIGRTTLDERLRRGWDFGRALSEAPDTTCHAKRVLG